MPPTGTETPEARSASADLGVTKGCNPPLNDRYCVGSTVTRGEMAAFLVRAKGLVDTGGKDWFVDDDDSIFENDINKLAASGITKGCNPPTNNQYCPQNPVLRDQMGSFLARALELAPITPPAVTTFGDGIWIVGADASRYVPHRRLTRLVLRARLSGFGGTFGEIIANEIGVEPLTVTIDGSGAGFESSRCGSWTNQLTPRINTPTSGFGDGYWSVGDELT